MKHTPKPWQMEKGLRSSTWFIHNSGAEVCMIPNGTVHQEGNARLIAAAPDLLEACEVALEHFDAETDTHVSGEAAILRLKEAIKKAKVN